MSDPVDPLPSGAKKVLQEAQASAPEPSAEASQRMLSRLQASMQAAAVTPAAPGAPAAAVAGTSKVLAVIIASVVAGLGGLVLGRTVFAPPPQVIERVRMVDAAVAPAGEPAPVPAPPALVAEPEPERPRAAERRELAPIARVPRAPAEVAPPATTATTATTAAPAAVDELLARERELIDTARSALLHGNATGAIAACQSHESQFSAGRLAEERESLWVQALVLAGSLPAARARAEAFHIRFPKSLMAQTVDAALETP